MDPNSIVFTSTVTDRNLTITLKEGTPTTFGRQHIITSVSLQVNTPIYA
jgi:hypothetical protein